MVILAERDRRVDAVDLWLQVVRLDARIVVRLAKNSTAEIPKGKSVDADPPSAAEWALRQTAPGTVIADEANKVLSAREQKAQVSPQRLPPVWALLQGRTGRAVGHENACPHGHVTRGHPPFFEIGASHCGQ